MTDAILALNAGSSSLKVALFEIDATGTTPTKILSGLLEGIGTAPHFVAHDNHGAIIGERRWEEGDGKTASHEDLLDGVLTWIEDHLGEDTLVAVGHRVVHGGPTYSAPVLLTAAVVEALAEFTPLAPLHQPHCLSPVRAIAAVRPELPQVACFDTAFHHTLPAVATRFALPRRYAEAAVRRYGFHGLSYSYIARALQTVAPALAKGRVIVAHLGNGDSLCALRGGVSIDTTMGFTALDGLVMGTRCGTLDAGVVLYMLQHEGLSASQIEHVLYSESGLLGVSGISSDVRTLLASDAPEAREALELFTYRAARDVAALTHSLGGLDGIVFTAGIGEHAASVRAKICERLGWLGVSLDAEANTQSAAIISLPTSRVEVRVIPTDEEAMIAIGTLALIHSHS